VNALTLCIFSAAALVMLGCWDVAHRMSWRTRHSMRLAIVLSGVAACLALLGERDAALLAALAGCALYRFFDRRSEVWRERVLDNGAGAGRAVANPPAECAQCAHQPAGAPAAGVGGHLHLAIDRSRDVMERRRAVS
jgi:hypothetical protein